MTRIRVESLKERKNKTISDTFQYQKVRTWVVREFGCFWTEVHLTNAVDVILWYSSCKLAQIHKVNLASGDRQWLTCPNMQFYNVGVLLYNLRLAATRMKRNCLQTNTVTCWWQWRLANWPFWISVCTSRCVTHHPPVAPPLFGDLIECHVYSIS